MTLSKRLQQRLGPVASSAINSGYAVHPPFHAIQISQRYAEIRCPVSDNPGSKPRQMSLVGTRLRFKATTSFGAAQNWLAKVYHVSKRRLPCFTPRGPRFGHCKATSALSTSTIHAQRPDETMVNTPIHKSEEEGFQSNCLPTIDMHEEDWGPGNSGEVDAFPVRFSKWRGKRIIITGSRGNPLL